LQRAIAAITLLAFVPATALAQYPGGGAGTGTYPGGTRPSYGSKGAVIGGFAAGAAVGAGLRTGSFTAEPSFKVAFLMAETSWSQRRTTTPTTSPTSKTNH